MREIPIILSSNNHRAIQKACGYRHKQTEPREDFSGMGNPRQRHPKPGIKPGGAPAFCRA
jgi:hypothetical protein